MATIKTPQVNTDYMLGANEGDARTAENMYIILHESGNQNDVNDSQAVLHEVQFMKNNWSNAYVHFFVGGGGQIYQIGEVGYVSWGALSANPYSPVQIELARTANNDVFKKDYAAYINLARYYANKYGIPLTLDAGGAGTAGVKTHNWVTQNYDGDHTDPYEYLARFGITPTKLAHDIANGVDDQPVNTISNVIKINVGAGKMATMFNSKLDAYDTTWCSDNSEWQSFGVIPDKLGRPMFKIANDMYMPQRSTNLNGILTINYLNGYGPNAVNAKGQEIANSNSTFKGGTKWKTDDKLYNIKNVGYCYKVAPNEYVSSKYQVGSGFKG